MAHTSEAQRLASVIVDQDYSAVEAGQEKPKRITTSYGQKTVIGIADMLDIHIRGAESKGRCDVIQALQQEARAIQSKLEAVPDNGTALETAESIGGQKVVLLILKALGTQNKKTIENIQPPSGNPTPSSL